MSLLKKIDSVSEKLILSLFLITMTILIFVQVVSRYVFGDTITWTEEVTRYMFIWLIFLTVGVGFKEEKHISINIVADLLPKKIKKILRQFVYLVVLGLSFLFMYEGFLLVQQMMTFGQTSANLRIPMWIVYLSLPVGFLLTAVRLVQVSIRLWTQPSEEVG